MRHSDDCCSVVQRSLLGPGGDAVAAAELLGLPRPVRLERVRRHDVRHVVQQGAEMAGQIGVPGVGVQDVAALEGRGHPQVD